MDKGIIYSKVNNSFLFVEHYWKNILIGVMAVLLFFSFKACNKNKDQYNNLVAKQDWLERKVDSLTNAKGEKVMESNVVKTTDKDFIKNVSDSLFDLKKKDAKKVKSVSALGEADQVFNLHNQYIPIDTSGGVNDHANWVDLTIDSTEQVRINGIYHGHGFITHTDSVKYNGFKEGDHFKKDTSIYSISATLAYQNGQRELRIDDLTARDSLYWRIIEKRKGFLKGTETVAQIINTNPVFDITGTRTMIFKNKVSKWNQWIKPALVGIAALFIRSKLK